MWPHQSIERRRRTSLDLLAMLFLIPPKIPLAFLATRAHYWIMANLLLTRTPKSFSAELLSSRSYPNYLFLIKIPSLKHEQLVFLHFLAFNTVGRKHEVL